MKKDRHWRGPVTGGFDSAPVQHVEVGRFGLWFRLYRLRTLRYLCTPSLVWMGEPSWGSAATHFDGVIELSDDGDAWTGVDSISQSVGRVVSLNGSAIVFVRIRHRVGSHVVYERNVDVRSDDVWVIRAHDGWRWNSARDGRNWIESGWLSDYWLGGPLLKRARTRTCRPETAWIPSKEQRAFR